MRLSDWELEEIKRRIEEEERQERAWNAWWDKMTGKYYKIDRQHREDARKAGLAIYSFLKKAFEETDVDPDEYFKPVAEKIADLLYFYLKNGSYQKYYDLLYSMWLVLDDMQVRVPSLTLEKVEEQLDSIYDLAKKYSQKVDEVPGATVLSVSKILLGLIRLYEGEKEKGAKLILNGINHIKSIKVDRVIDLDKKADEEAIVIDL